MTDAPSPIPPGGLEITETAIGNQFKAQLRIWVASAGAALLGRYALPPSLFDDRTVDLVTGAILLGAGSALQWLRVRLVNSRWWHLATDPRVPNELVRPASTTKGN
jgi:hypothetical protein